MEEKIIEIGEKKYTIKELKYKDIAVALDMKKEDVSKFMIKNSASITDEEYDNLGMKDGIKIMNAVNEINGLVDSDFQEAK